MNTISVFRDKHSPTQTEGVLVVLDANGQKLFSCFTMELPWRNNERKVSCIPPGRYQVVHRKSPKYGDHFHILNVPNRDLILIHQANYARQLQGCIGVGKNRMDIDRDGKTDITDSVATMKKLLELIPKTSWLVIS
jgi:hypothetical protein